MTAPKISLPAGHLHLQDFDIMEVVRKTDVVMRIEGRDDLGRYTLAWDDPAFARTMAAHGRPGPFTLSEDNLRQNYRALGPSHENGAFRAVNTSLIDKDSIPAIALREDVLAQLEIDADYASHIGVYRPTDEGAMLDVYTPEDFKARFTFQPGYDLSDEKLMDAIRATTPVVSVAPQESQDPPEVQNSARNPEFPAKSGPVQAAVPAAFGGGATPSGASMIDDRGSPFSHPAENEIENPTQGANATTAKPPHPGKPSEGTSDADKKRDEAVRLSEEERARQRQAHQGHVNPGWAIGQAFSGLITLPFTAAGAASQHLVSPVIGAARDSLAAYRVRKASDMMDTALARLDSLEGLQKQILGNENIKEHIRSIKEIQNKGNSASQDDMAALRKSRDALRAAINTSDIQPQMKMFSSLMNDASRNAVSALNLADAVKEKDGHLFIRTTDKASEFARRMETIGMNMKNTDGDTLRGFDKIADDCIQNHEKMQDMLKKFAEAIQSFIAMLFPNRAVPSLVPATLKN